jgi:hypothetical protein
MFGEDLFVKFAGDPMGAEINRCIVKGNAASAEITAMRNDLAANWHPTGYYSPDQIEQVVGQMRAMAESADTMLDQGISFTSDMPDSEYPNQLRSEKIGLARVIDDGQRFLTAAQAVRAHGSGVVDAPDLKAWVMSALSHIDASVTAAMVIMCNQPWWGSLYAFFKNVLTFAWNTIKAVAGVVAAIGDFIASVPSAIGRFQTLLKWAVILGGGTLAVLFVRKKLYDKGLLPLSAKWQLPGG